MSIRIIRTDVEGLVDEELELANGKFPPFHTAHEGYAIIREEWKEHRREAVDMNELIQCLENAVFGDEAVDKYINSLEMTAINAACEAIQVAAMCRKFKALEDN
jgi:hypothetical protein